MHGHGAPWQLGSKRTLHLRNLQQGLLRPLGNQASVLLLRRGFARPVNSCTSAPTGIVCGRRSPRQLGRRWNL